MGSLHAWLRWIGWAIVAFAALTVYPGVGGIGETAKDVGISLAIFVVGFLFLRTARHEREKAAGKEPGPGP